jgi:hypothetical protein
MAFGATGLEALAFLESHHRSPPDWKDTRLAAIVEAQEPSGLVKFHFLPALRKLVEQAGQSH